VNLVFAHSLLVRVSVTLPSLAKQVKCVNVGRAGSALRLVRSQKEKAL
jgi:hypothetical protein